MMRWIFAAFLSLSAACPAQAAKIPIPLEKPSDTGTAEAPKPEANKTPLPQSAPDVKEKQDDKKAVFKPPQAEDEAALRKCLADLKSIGAEFEPVEPIDDGNGCGIRKPIVLHKVLPGVEIAPEATVRCETALQLARWTKESVLPAAVIAYEKSKITTIRNASDYVCRRRNNAKTGKLSEHARGNAIDIGGFDFSDGKQLSIESRALDSTLEGAFQRAIRASACLYFTTALGPGSDTAHATHFHFDVLKRKSGYRYCR